MAGSYCQRNKAIYRAYVSGDMLGWKLNMESLETQKNVNNADRLEFVNYLYGYTAWCVDQNRRDEADLCINKARKLIKYLEVQAYGMSMLYAYKAAFIGYEIGLSPYKAPFVGARSLEYANMAVNQDSTNAFGYIQLGNISYYTPKIFGGSKKEAMFYYLKALDLMERFVNENKYNWNYLNLQASIINAYLELEEYKLAKKYCIKVLEIESEFEWVKEVLYPEVLKKL